MNYIPQSVRKSFLILALTAFGAVTGFASETEGACGGACCSATGAKAEAGKITGDPYTLTTCPVSGMALGKMGKPVVHNYNGREVRFCCEGCVGKFEKNADEYIQKIDAEVIKQQSEVYPLETCLVTGGKLGSMGEPVNYVYNNRLVKLCCAGCIEQIEADPAKYIAKLDEAVIAKQKDTYKLTTCAVTDEKLEAMGKPVDVVIANQLVRLCCAGCKGKLMEDPTAYLSKVQGKETGKAEAKAEDGHAGHNH